MSLCVCVGVGVGGWRGTKKVMSHSLNGGSVGALTCVSLSCLLSDGVEASVITALPDRDLGSGNPCREHSRLLLGDTHRFLFGVGDHPCLLSTHCIVSLVTGS